MSEDDALDVVIGAGSGIGGALVKRWQSSGQRPVLAVARPSEALDQFDGLQGVTCEETDYTDERPLVGVVGLLAGCLLYTSPSPRDRQKSRMPSSA